MKRFLLATAAVLGMAGVAAAADFPVKATPAPVYANPQFIGSWTGGYIGAKIGYGWDWTGMDLTNGKTTLTGLGNAPHGFTGGAELGYDAQVGNLVFGIMADINGANFDNNTATGLGIVTGATTNWWGRLNGRLGFSIFGDHVLPYITGGVAYGGNKATFAMGNSFNASAEKTSVGWDVGVGIETRFTRNWSMFIEGTYVDLGSVTVPLVSGPNLVITSSQKFTYGVVEGGLKYRF